LTPTFATVRAFVDNWRWQGVPFYLTSGKRLAKKMTEIVIDFKKAPHTMFRGLLGDSIGKNRLTLGIYPDERIHLSFQTKNPGAKVCLRSVRMDFDYRQNYTGPVLDAYEKAIIDCIQGDHMLFWRQDGVELCWAFLDPLLEACGECFDTGPDLLFYPAGGSGPSFDGAPREE
ncbi:MAG: glucose-6-phosphate dehydrogenase, partial [Pseudomonadota bacterium]